MSEPVIRIVVEQARPKPRWVRVIETAASILALVLIVLPPRHRRLV